MSGHVTGSREGLDDNNWLLEKEVSYAITAINQSLYQLELERSVHTKAAREFSQALNMILTGYRKGNISYEVADDLIKKIKTGFIEGRRALQREEFNRKIRNEQREQQRIQDGTDQSYRRNLRVNNQSFNVRFHASCATPECLMRNANIDMEDDAFQDYIEAATQDKRSDVMQVIGVALIANPYLKVLERVAYADMGISLLEGNLNPVWAFAMGKGAAYRLKLLNLHERAWKSAENATSYVTGGFLGSN